MITGLKIILEDNSFASRLPYKNGPTPGSIIHWMGVDILIQNTEDGANNSCGEHRKITGYILNTTEARKALDDGFAKAVMP